MAHAVAKGLPKGGVTFREIGPLPFLGLIVVVSFLALFFVWSRIQVINFEYGISSLESQLRTVAQQNQQLKLESASLRKPTRIERIARQRLGLRMPHPEQVIMVR